MYERILIPLDGSDLAEAVLPFAIALADKFQSSVYLLQVVPLASQLTGIGLGGSTEMGTVIPPDVEALNAAMEAEARRAEEYLESTGQRLRGQGLAVEWETRRGTAAEEIVRCARERDANLIAISTHGRSGLSRLFFGSVADKVLRQAGIPVLLIRPMD